MRTVAWIVVALVAAGSTAAVVASKAGGSHRRDVLYAGVHLGRLQTGHGIDDGEARLAVGRAYATWRAELRHRALIAPRQRFDNPSRRAFETKLRRLARANGFRVVSARLRHPRGAAPDLVVSSRAYERLAREVPDLLQQLDPKSDTGDDRTGWRWEGFFFEAVDERGVPFLATFNFWRGPSAGGGQWARSDALYPFAHL